MVETKFARSEVAIVTEMLEPDRDTEERPFSSDVEVELEYLRECMAKILLHIAGNDCEAVSKILDSEYPVMGEDAVERHTGALNSNPNCYIESPGQPSYYCQKCLPGELDARCAEKVEPPNDADDSCCAGQLSGEPCYCDRCTTAAPAGYKETPEHIRKINNLVSESYRGVMKDIAMAPNPLLATVDSGNKQLADAVKGTIGADLHVPKGELCDGVVHNDTGDVVALNDDLPDHREHYTKCTANAVVAVEVPHNCPDYFCQSCFDSVMAQEVKPLRPFEEVERLHNRVLKEAAEARSHKMELAYADHLSAHHECVGRGIRILAKEHGGVEVHECCGCGEELVRLHSHEFVR